jgi:peptidoglycan/xylan/chitin deacetylase (PgdA/CDA1 family)
MLINQAQDPNSGSFPKRAAGMASRFLARQSRAKMLTLDNVPPMVSFTFDDVPASACELGARILQQRGARGTFYVAGSGTAGPCAPARATIDQLRTVWANGHEIGCHTFSHPSIRQLSLEQLGWELDRNRSALNTISDDIVVQNFAYPYGDLSIRTKRYLESRFDSCRSSHAAINIGTADLGALDAWPLQNASIDHTKVVELIDATAHTRGWLIFYTHDVAESPSKYGVSPDLLEWTVGTANRSGCVLTTIAESLSLIRDSANPK